MKNFETLYFPLFYKWVSITEEFSDAEFGRLIRAVLRGAATGEEPKGLPKHLAIAYRFIYDAAQRVTEENARKTEQSRRAAQARWGDSGAKATRERERQGTFDPEEAFRRALERSYGKSAKTAVNDGGGAAKGGSVESSASEG